MPICRDEKLSVSDVSHKSVTGHAKCAAATHSYHPEKKTVANISVRARIAPRFGDLFASLHCARHPQMLPSLQDPRARGAQPHGNARGPRVRQGKERKFKG
jgi:hypothetical protein